MTAMPATTAGGKTTSASGVPSAVMPSALPPLALEGARRRGRLDMDHQALPGEAQEKEGEEQGRPGSPPPP